MRLPAPYSHAAGTLLHCILTDMIDEIVVVCFYAALIVGVSRYASNTKNPYLNNWPDLPGVRASVQLMKDLWTERNFAVRTVVDENATDKVTPAKILRGVRK